MLHPSRHAGETGERVERRVDRRSGSDGQPQRRERVARLERAHQRQLQRPPLGRTPSIVIAWPVAVGRAAMRRSSAGASVAEADDALPPCAAERRKSPALGRVEIEHGGAVARQKLGEEPRLRREIRGHVGVIVEMVARQVGEGRRREREPVEAVLVEAVARRLERDVIDAGPRKLLQGAVERHRIGGGQAAGPGEIGADDAERAETRRAATRDAARSGG